ncbi:MAG: cation:proton antiporter [Gemmataceae bacterium]|nr:cation:proton antiporter [Gemmataceae bacterium]
MVILAAESPILLPLLLQLAVVLSAARLAAWLFRRVGQPAVVGEIAAGLALGPSLLGWLAPTMWAALFRPEVAGLAPEKADWLLSQSLSVLAQLGLVLLLFLVGLESDLGHLRKNTGAALAISVTGVAVPFALGAGLGWLMHPDVGTGAVLPFSLFLGMALSITAIPVLARMMLELGITRTRLSALVLTAAAADDAAGWVLLAAIASLAAGSYDPWSTARMAALTVGFVALLLLARPWLRGLSRRLLASGDLRADGFALLLVLLLMCAAATSAVGVFAVFGAFVLGTALSGEPALRESVNRRLRDFVTVFFLPLFFAYTGLRTDIGSLGGAWGWAAAVTGCAIVGKLGACTAAARLAGMTWREAGCVGALMDARGMMGLVAANLGRDLGVIPESVFCMLVLMALATTCLATPLLLWWSKGTELEEPIRESGFRGGR